MNFIIPFLIGGIVGFLVCKIFFTKKPEEKINQLNIQIARLEEQNTNLQQTQLIGDKLKEFLSKEFEGLANKALKENAEELSKTSKNSVEALLTPVQERLKEFQEKVEKFNKEGTNNTTLIKSQIENLEKNNAKIIDETNALTNALKSNRNVKGAYGENLLATLLQSAGLIEGKQYNYHPTLENGIPDFIVNLPDKKGIIIDSKNVLESYIDFTNEENKEEKDKKSKAFKSAVKQRIKELNDKHYNETEKIYSLDFILMFIPVESSLNILYDDIDLINEALSKNVIIVGTSSLLTTIKLINFLWKQNDQNINAKEIAKAGADLYDIFVKLLDNLTEIQKKFNDVSKAFTTSINRFKRGEDCLFNKVEDLKRLGINPTAQIPDKFLETGSDFEEVLAE